MVNFKYHILDEIKFIGEYEIDRFGDPKERQGTDSNLVAVSSQAIQIH